MNVIMSSENCYAYLIFHMMTFLYKGKLYILHKSAIQKYVNFVIFALLPEE